MSHQPFTAAALRGAVDLSSLKRPAPQAGPVSGGGSTSTSSTPDTWYGDGGTGTNASAAGGDDTRAGNDCDTGSGNDDSDSCDAVGDSGGSDGGGDGGGSD